MIKSNELRVGNWVYYTGIRCEVSIKGAGIELVESGEMFLEPIPLTPEILEKAGFEKVEFEDSDLKYEWKRRSGVIYFANGKGIFKEGTYVYSGLGDPESYGFRVPVQYVHQLQNLYFALTGEELPIQL